MIPPKSWESAELSQLIEAGRPITYGIVKPGDFVDDGIPMVRGGDYSGGWRETSEIKKVSRDIDAPYERSRIKAGDLVLTLVGANIGDVAIVPPILEGANISRTLARLAIDSKNTHPKFILHYLQSSNGKRLIYNIRKGGAQPGLNLSDVAKFRIVLPKNLAEQDEIVEILDTWDEAIEKTEKLIAAKRVARTGIARQLLFGIRRLGNFGRTQPREEDRWFSIPTDWQIVHIGNVASSRSETNGNGTDLPVLSCTKYDGLVDSLEYFGKRIFSEDTSTYKVVENGDFAYATNHLEEGSIGYQDCYEKALISPMYTVFRVTSDEVDVGYLYKLFKTETFRRIFEAYTSASVNRRGSLRWSQFSRIRIPLPPKQEQEAINAVLDDLDHEIGLLRDHLTALQDQKRGLMQKLLTGEWRVNDGGGP